MSDTLRKRGRETEALLDSTDVQDYKRFNGTGEEMDLFRHFPAVLGKTQLADREASSNEDFLSGVMRSLEEEDISTTTSTFYAPISVHNSPASDICRGYEGQTLVSDSGIDLSYLLEASDDDLGIPSGPSLDFNNEICQSSHEILSAEGLSENSDLKCEGENWDFEDEVVENYQQFVLYEDAWDVSQVQSYMNREFASQDMFFDGDFSAAWTSETIGCT